MQLSPRLRVEALEAREVPAALAYALTDDNSLVRLSVETGTADPEPPVELRGLDAGERVMSIDFRPATGQLYGVIGYTNKPSDSEDFRLVYINPLTGTTNPVGVIGAFGKPSTPVPSDPTGLDFDDGDDTVRIQSAVAQGYLSGFDGKLGFTFSHPPSGAEVSSGRFEDFAYAPYPNAPSEPSYYTATRSRYQLIRDESGLLSLFTVQVSPQRLIDDMYNGGEAVLIGSLGVSSAANATAGFDITSDGTAYALIGDEGTGTTALYRVNLTTGAATPVGDVGAGLYLGLAVVPPTGINTNSPPNSYKPVAPPVVPPPTAPPSEAPSSIESPPSYPTGLIPLTPILPAVPPTSALLTEASRFDPFPGFGGGFRVATGDMNRDGVEDVIAGAQAGGGPHVKVFDGVSGAELYSFYAYMPAFTGGVSVAAGDVNGDGYADILTGAGAGGGPHVKVFSGKDGSELASFYAFDPTFAGGVRVSAGDFDADGTDEIVTAAGPGGGPHVRIWGRDANGTVAPYTGTPGLSNSFYAYDPTFTGGVWVTAGDITGDGRADIVTGPDAGMGPTVRAYSGKDGAKVAEFTAYDPAFLGGVRVGLTDKNGDGRLDIATAVGPGGGFGPVRWFDFSTGTLND